MILIAAEDFDGLTNRLKLNSSFAKEDLIDEIILNVEPVVIGKGIPLFSPQDFDLNLQLISSTKVNENILQLHYKVKE